MAESSEKNKTIIVKVFQSLFHSFNINIMQTNTAVGFSAEEILAFQKKCIELRPELANYQLVYISNSEAVSGISFTFLLDSNYVIANCSYEGDNLIVKF